MIASFLPSNYHDSKRLFYELAAQLKTSVDSYTIDNEKHPENALSIDTIYLGDKHADKIFIITSGTHGVESYAGAACQFKFMDTYQRTYSQSGWGFLLVHALNPWGYQNNCRVTEENIDLNRNFIDFTKPLPNSGEYAKYHDLLVTHYQPGLLGWLNEFKLLTHCLTKTKRKCLQASITSGQHRYPNGLFYGGTQPAKNRIIWESILAKYIKNRKRVCLLDIHTGLGKFGEGTLISHLPSSSSDYQKMKTWFGSTLSSFSNGSAVSAAIQGSLAENLVKHIPDHCFSLVLEFGIKPPLAVLNAMRFDNFYRRKIATPVKNFTTTDAEYKMKAAFLSSTPSWEKSIVTKFEQIIQQFIDGVTHE